MEKKKKNIWAVRRHIHDGSSSNLWVLLKIEWLWEVEEGGLGGEEEEEQIQFLGICIGFLEPGRVHLSTFRALGPPFGILGEL